MSRDSLVDDDGEGYACQFCGKVYDTKQARGNHRGQAHADEVPWKDEELMDRLYNEEGLTLSEIGERFDISASSLSAAFDKLGIERRKVGKRALPHHRFTERGYEQWAHTVNGEKHTVYVHRLAAVAWFGFGAVVDRHVHHETPVKWLNVEWNLVPVAPGEHLSEHMTEWVDRIIFGDDGKIVGWEQ